MKTYSSGDFKNYTPGKSLPEILEVANVLLGLDSHPIQY